MFLIYAYSFKYFRRVEWSKLLLMKSTLPGKKIPQQNFQFPSGGISLTF